MVKYLIKQGCDPTVDDNLAIQYATKNGHIKIVKYLKSIGCNAILIDRLVKKYNVNYINIISAVDIMVSCEILDYCNI